jgi:hypothetical protein
VKDNPDRAIGFVAQEVKEMAPEVVWTTVNNKYHFKRYDQITALLCKGIKEPQATIEELSARVAALEACWLNPSIQEALPYDRYKPKTYPSGPQWPQMGNPYLDKAFSQLSREAHINLTQKRKGMRQIHQAQLEKKRLTSIDLTPSQLPPQPPLQPPQAPSRPKYQETVPFEEERALRSLLLNQASRRQWVVL